MSDKNKTQQIESNRRSLLALVPGVAGLVTAKSWISPVVKSVALPAHAQSTCQITITNLHVTNERCIGEDPVRYEFYIEYNFSSTCGIVSHVFTASDCGDDTLDFMDGAPADLGDNLLTSDTGGSFFRDGTPFQGTAQVMLNTITGPNPQDCAITLTLRDANGGQASATVTPSRSCEPD